MKFLLVGLLTTSCFGQHLFEFGVKGGVPLSPAIETGTFFTIGFGEGATSSTRRYTIGPTIELRLPHGFGLEFDALYTRLGYDDLTKSVGIYYVQTRTIAGSWEFPVVGKYHFRRSNALRPFVDGGVSFRRLGGVSTTGIEYTGIPSNLNGTVNNSTFGIDRSNHGGVVGGGLEFRLGILRITPEIRYTRWGADSNLDPQLYSNQNQFSLLVGISF